MKTKENITLFMVCDNHLAIMLATLLKSIEIHHISEEIIDIYIIDDGISKIKVEKINKSITSTKLSLHWKPLNEVIPKGIKLPLDKTTLPLCIYARLFAQDFLPQTVKKAIYLDVDMILMRDIEELWYLDINGHVIAAVVDNMEVVSSSWGAILNYKELGLSPDTKYFNAGLLIIDLEKWRRLNATELVIDSIRNNIEFVTFTDQYGLNVVFANKWFELDPKWNTYSHSNNNSPFLIHFTGVKPIYKGYHFNKEYKDIFYCFVKLTPWPNFKARGNYIRKIKKLHSMVSNKSWKPLLVKFLNTITRKVRLTG